MVNNVVTLFRVVWFMILDPNGWFQGCFCVAFVTETHKSCNSKRVGSSRSSPVILPFVSQSEICLYYVI